MKTSRILPRAALVAIVALMATALPAHAAASDVARPNILFILTDDQSHRTVGAYEAAHPWAQTPNIDRLARNGVRFRNAYVGTWCMPARLSLLTGRMPYAVKSMRMEGPYPGAAYDPAAAPFWPAAFREHGYFTAHIGKWHLGGDTGFGRDWDYQASWSRPVPENLTDDTGYYWNQRISFNGAPATPVEGYSTDNYTQWALDFIQGDQRKPDQPWCLWLCYTAPHGPFTPADRHLDDYAGATVPTPKDIYPPRPGKPGYMQKIESWVPGADGEPRYASPEGQTLTASVRQYNQIVSAVDEGIGRILATLEETGQLRNTLVVFASDQGFAWGQHGFRHKVAPYDANLRAPLIVSMPGTLPEGPVVDAPVGGVDIVPTLFNMAGVRQPWRMHGHDLTPLLRDAGSARPEPVLLSYNGWTFGDDTAAIPASGHDTHPSGVSWYVSLRRAQYKYIRTLAAGEPEELYDLNDDPEELTNLALDPAFAALLLDLRGTAIAELRRTEAPFVDRLPPVREPSPAGTRAQSTAAGGERPNILWITCEDASPTLGCYGDPYATTPNLDQLAARGVRYSRAFAVTGVCATSRSSIIMGMYASTIGAQHMRSIATLPRTLHPFPYYLRQAGYYTTNKTKTDYNFPVPDGVWDANDAKSHWRNRRPGQPFFSVVNFGETHEWHIRDYSRVPPPAPDLRHDPARADLPPYLPDTPKVRREWARQYDLMTIFDSEGLPALLNELREDGLAEDTIVFFFSDHGIGLPRAKQFIFDSGMQTPLIAYFPEKWRHLAPAPPGSVVDRMVSFVDLGPTILSLAGIPIPEYMQGIAFLGEQTGPPREHIYGIRDRMDERYDMSRTVRDDRFKYHRNYMPYLPHFPWLDYMDQLETAREFRRLAAAGELSGGQAYFMAQRKSIEELYDLQSDPYELRNLADDPAYAGHLERLRRAHFDWARQTRDTGFIPEQMLRSSSAEGAEYDYAQSEQFDLDRCIEAARLIERGAGALPELIEALADAYAPVRFWAAVGLANLGSEAGPAVQALRVALDDIHPEVAITAAEALCYAGQPEPALPVLAKHLRSGNLYSTLLAANVVDRIDAQARPLVEEMRRQAAIKRTGTLAPFVAWVLDQALRELDAIPETIANHPTSAR